MKELYVTYFVRAIHNDAEDLEDKLIIRFVWNEAQDYVMREGVRPRVGQRRGLTLYRQRSLVPEMTTMRPSIPEEIGGEIYKTIFIL